MVSLILIIHHIRLTFHLLILQYLLLTCFEHFKKINKKIFYFFKWFGFWGCCRLQQPGSELRLPSGAPWAPEEIFDANTKWLAITSRTCQYSMLRASIAAFQFPAVPHEMFCGMQFTLCGGITRRKSRGACNSHPNVIFI